MRNTIEFTKNKIVLRIGNPLDWPLVQRITGKVEEVEPGTYQLGLSTQNMHRILQYFPGEQKPTVIAGRHFLDRLQDRLRKYKEHRARVQEIIALESYPIAPNGKFIPYKHQTKICGCILVNPFCPVCADCGTGKTGSTGRAIEEVLRTGEVRSGKILVSAPLSILETSWADDLRSFTHLRFSTLWTPISNRTVLGAEKIDLGAAGDESKPAFAVTTKSKTGVRYRHNLTGRIKERLDALDGDPKNWTKYQANWKVAVMLDGTEQPFGRITGRTTVTERTRENYVLEQLARKDVDLYLINHDGVRIYREILKQHKFEWLVVDESTKIKNPEAEVTQAHIDISWDCVRRNALSGTPNPNGFIDLWSQFFFLDRGLTLEPIMKDFLYEYFKPVVVGVTNTAAGPKNQVKYELRGENERKALVDRVRSVGIFINQRDCLDLPPRQNLRRIAYMTAEQERAYDDMAIHLVAELRDVETGKSVRADAVNSLAKIMKLRQITSGFLSNREGELVAMSSNPKFNDLEDFLEDIGYQKIVVACQFREEIKILLDRYKHLGARAVMGGISVADRNQTIRDFQTTDTCNMIIVQPKAAGHGITLVRSPYFWFQSLDYNFELYYQVAKRIERIGQKGGFMPDENGMIAADAVPSIFVNHSLARYSDNEATIDEDLYEIMQMKNGDRNALFSPQDAHEIADILTQRLIERTERRYAR